MGNHVTGGMSRDEACASGASFLASLGAFGEDILMYGCAYLENGKVIYRISPDAGQIYQFQTRSAHQQLYPTAVADNIHRTTVAGGMREQIAYEAKLALAHQLQTQYPRCFFELLEPFTKTPANNSSFALLAEMADTIDGYFDDGKMQLLEGTMELAYDAKVLDEEGYQSLSQWLQKTRHQMEGDTIVQDKICRTMYGFCYQETNGVIKSVLNAQAVRVYERRAALLQAGKLAGPMMQRTYWVKDFGQISTARENFKALLEQLQNEDYFALLSAIKILPTAIDQTAFQQALAQIEASGASKAIADFKGYGYRWNVLNNNTGTD